MSAQAIDVTGRLSRGTVDRGFEAVRNKLDAFLLEDACYSAQLSAYWRGRLVVDLVGGADLDEDSITGVFSATKGVSGVVIALLVERGELDLDETVSHYWPEFSDAGKSRITVRQLLSHQAGLVGVPGGFEAEDLTHSERAAARLAAMRPLWQPGSTHGYHGLTIGVFMEELVRRITGTTLQAIYESEIRAPREIDFYLGLPADEEPRFREILPPVLTNEQRADMDRRATASDGISALAHNSVNVEMDPSGGPFSPNRRAVRAAGTAAAGGIGSARGLAGVYAAALGSAGVPGLLSADAIAQVNQQQVYGLDRVLNLDMCFGIVFMKPQPRMEFASYLAFGHDGAGGALGFADPLYELAFGYIPMPMQYPGGADPKAVQLSRLIRSCIRLLS